MLSEERNGNAARNSYTSAAAQQNVANYGTPDRQPLLLAEEYRQTLNENNLLIEADQLQVLEEIGKGEFC